MSSNKVKYNLCNCHWAALTVGEDGAPTYGTVNPLPGAVSLTLSPNGEPDPFYADGVQYYVVNNSMGYDGDLEIALIPDEFRAEILKETKDSNGVLVENSNAETGSFALLFEFDGDQKKIRHVLYNCSAARPNIEGATNTETKEVKTETLSLKARPLADGLVKTKTTAETSEATYTSWYKSVYIPKITEASASTGGTGA